MIGSKVSKRYAKALFSLGQEDDRLEQYGNDLIEFTDFCKRNEEFWKVIANPIFAPASRKNILAYVLERSPFSEVVKNFLKLLLDKDRIGDIQAIASHYARLQDDVSAVARAEIVTARPLKDEARKRIEKTLERLISKDIRSEVREDPSLIGGILVKIGDMVFDGSVRAQLEGLKQSF